MNLNMYINPETPSVTSEHQQPNWRRRLAGVLGGTLLLTGGFANDAEAHSPKSEVEAHSISPDERYLPLADEIDCVEDEPFTVQPIYSFNEVEDPEKQAQIQDVLDKTQALLLELSSGQRAWRIDCDVESIEIGSQTHHDIQKFLEQERSFDSEDAARPEGTEIGPSGYYDIQEALKNNNLFNEGHIALVFADFKNEDGFGGLSLVPSPEDAKNGAPQLAVLYDWSEQTAIHELFHSLSAIQTDGSQLFECQGTDKNPGFNGGHSPFKADILFCGGGKDYPEGEKYRCLSIVLDCEGRTYWTLDRGDAFWDNIRNTATSPYLYRFEEEKPEQPQSSEVVQFNDSAEGDVHYDAIKKLVEEGILKGHHDGSFEPNDPMMRRHVAAALMRSQTEFDPRSPLALHHLWEADPAFLDVSGEEPINDRGEDGVGYYSAVQWATRARPFFGGVNDTGSFKPTDPMTRGQLASVIKEYIGYVSDTDHIDEMPPVIFTDSNKNQTHAGAIGSVAALGIIEGFPDGTSRPNEPISRGQFATVLTRLEDAGLR